MRTRRPSARKPAFERLVIDSLPRGGSCCRILRGGFFWRDLVFCGYNFPVEFWGQMDMGQQQEQVGFEDHKQPKSARIRLGPSPGVKPMDLIIDFKNFRYKVVNVSGTSLNGVSVRQDLQVVQLERGCIEDKIPLKLPSTDFVPQRNFENAQSADSFTLKALKKYGY